MAISTLLGSVGPAEAAPSLSAERVNGVYRYHPGPGDYSEVDIELLPNGRLAVSFDLVFQLPGAMGPNLGESSGQATLRGTIATYKSREYPACAITIEFKPGNRLQVSQQGDSADCGFGLHVMADGSYQKASGRKPPPPLLPKAPPDPQRLGQAAADDERQALGAPDLIAPRSTRIVSLAKERAAALKDIAVMAADFNKHSKAAEAAEKKKDQAAAKAEYQLAATAGDALVKATAALRALEDELAQLAAEVALAAGDASAAAKDVSSGLHQLITLGTKSNDAAKKAATDAATTAHKALTALNVPSLAKLAAQREIARQDDVKLAAEHDQNRQALTDVDAAIKASSK